MSISVTEAIRRCRRVYDALADRDDPVTTRPHQAALTEASQQLLALWQHCKASGIFSRNEEIKEWSTEALSMLTLPFKLAQVAEKQMLAAQASDGDAVDPRARGGTGGPGHAAGATASFAGQRRRALGVASAYYKEYLQVCLDATLVTETEVDRHSDYRGAGDRQARVQRHRQTKELREQISALDKTIAFGKAKARRMKRIVAADGDIEDGAGDTVVDATAGDFNVMGTAGGTSRLDAPSAPNAASGAASASAPAPAVLDATAGDADDDGAEDEFEDQIRERHVLEAKLCVLESFDSLQMAQQELQMLGALSDTEKAAAVEAYQAQRSAPRDASQIRNVVITGSDRIPAELPRVGMQQSDAALAESDAASLGLTGTAAAQHATQLLTPVGGANYRVLQCGHTAGVAPTGVAVDPMQRVDVRAQAFQNRNMPTQSLEEFAEGEMAFMKDQQRLELEGKMKLAEEEVLLGKEGVEERDRQAQAAKDDWRDDHPKYGITNKGNYT